MDFYIISTFQNTENAPTYPTSLAQGLEHWSCKPGAVVQKTISLNLD